MPNPFFYGGHVQPDQFVGRKAELRRIFSALETAHTGQLQSVSVVGPRRIGKSSLLYYVAHKPTLINSDAYRFAYVELSDANCRTLDGLLATILKQLGANKSNGKLSLTKFQDAIVTLKNSGKCPVVCLDEFEELTDHPDQFTLDLYDSWRYLINQHAMAFITGSKSPLIDLQQKLGYTSPFFNVFTHLPLGELANDEARELIARGAECDRPFTPAEQNDAWLMAGNHPYKLQLAGSLLYQSKADGGAIDWAKLRNDFVQQLRQVGLEADLGRNLKSFARQSGPSVKSATKATIQEIFKAWIDSMSKPR
jgi:uncharacterized protein